MSNSIKLLPNSLEAEQGVLAAILIDANIPMLVFPVLKKEDFFSQTHQIIYENMQEIYSQNKPVEFVTLVNKLESNNQMESVGGLEYITTLTNFLPSATNYKHYLDIVKNHSKRRKLIAASQAIADQCFENENSTEDLNFAEQQIFEISSNEQTSTLEHIGPSLNAVIDKFDYLAKNSGELRGIPTGFEDLDNLTGGFQNSDLIILAARPGVGKTSFAMNVINNAAINHGKSCAVFSLEMPKEQIAQRAMCAIGCVNMTKALKGQLNDEEWRKLWKAKKDLSNAKIYIDDNSLNTPTDILSKCRRLKLEHGLDIVMIDYLQLMNSDSINSRNRQQNRVLEIGDMTKTLKALAKELNIPVILLSQLSRKVDDREDHRPMPSDLRDSGSIEQDADIIMFIYNPAKYNDVVIESGQEGLVDLEIAKHRNGQPGTIQLRWVGEWTRFVDKSDKIHIPSQTISKTEKVETQELANSEEIDEIFGDVPPAENFSDLPEPEEIIEDYEEIKNEAIEEMDDFNEEE